MKTDPLRPREWLLSRHESMEGRLDALRQAALPAASVEATPGWAWRLLFPAATGLGAVLVVGTVVFQASTARRTARPEPANQPIAASSFTPDRDAGVSISPAAGVPAQAANRWAPLISRNPPVIRSQGLSALEHGLGPVDASQPFATEVFHFGRIKAGDAAKLVEPIIDLSGGGKVHVVTASNALVVTERTSRLNRLKPLLGALDRDPNAAALLNLPASGATGPLLAHQSPPHITTNDVAANSAPVKLTAASGSALEAAIRKGYPSKAPLPAPPATGTAESQRVWKPTANWANAGNATPAAAMETWLWANKTEQPEALLSTIAWTDAAAVRIAAFFEALPVSQRARFSGPGPMFVRLSLDGPSASDWTAMAITNQTTTTSGDVVVSAECQLADGRVRDHTRTFRRYADGWKIPLSDEAVEAVLNYHRRQGTLDEK
jgi:hypothetical protein